MQQRNAPDTRRRGRIAQKHRKNKIEREDSNDGIYCPNIIFDAERNVNDRRNNADVDGNDQKYLQDVAIDPSDLKSLFGQAFKLFASDVNFFSAKGAGIGYPVKNHTTVRTFHILR